VSILRHLRGPSLRPGRQTEGFSTAPLSLIPRSSAPGGLPSNGSGRGRQLSPAASGLRCQPLADSGEPSHGADGATTLNTSVSLIWTWRHARSSLAKYPALFLTKYRRSYRSLGIRLRQQLRLSLYLELNLDPCPDLNLNLNLNLIPQSDQSLFRQLFATLFGSMFGSKFVQLYVWMDSALCRQRPGGRRHVGRGVGGRIVVRDRRTTTYGMCIIGTSMNRIRRDKSFVNGQPSLVNAAAKSLSFHRFRISDF